MHQLWEGTPHGEVNENFEVPPSAKAGFSGSNTHTEGVRKQPKVVLSGSTTQFLFWDNFGCLVLICCGAAQKHHACTHFMCRGFSSISR